ncbi:MAG TPA: endo-1,4-beta-xylanase [bacterium]|nr:endo-1,4-beta-xylanase [bacterium]HPR88895.1 endo-1,4-beta-xylanase [bacterium]
MSNGTLILKPWLVQKGPGPHLDSFVYASDEEGDTFHSDIRLTREGIEISAPEGHDRFAINLRWKVEGYGYLYMKVDAGSGFYRLPPAGIRRLHLNHELAISRVAHNTKRYDAFCKTGWTPSRELAAFLDLSRTYLDDANRTEADPEQCAQYSQQALKYGLFASDLLEIEKARFDIARSTGRPPFLLGCDSRGFFQMEESLFLERFSELFNYATITHYLIGDVHNFEPEEGHKQFAERDRLVAALRSRDITVEGRPLLWLHRWVTPEWLTRKSYAQMKEYLARHVREVVGHYGDGIAVWEVVNELHDWANELELNHEQTIELTRLACDVARDTNPDIRLLINNCCPFAQYVQMGKWCDRVARFPQRTPFQFVKQLVEAGVDFDIAGVQMYFTKQLLADCVEMIERYQGLGKTVHLTEVGSPSAGVTMEFADQEILPWSAQPCEWLRHWDEELQADWLEAIFSIAFSKPWIEAANWYDLVDPYGYLKNGGLLRSPQGEKKAGFERLLALKQQFHRITAGKV